jgi:hypothetical protein
MGLSSGTSHADMLAEYERKVIETDLGNKAAERIANNRPSHPLVDYTGCYSDQGYGEIEVSLGGSGLCLQISDLKMPLEHWHFDCWIAGPSDAFAIHAPHCFDRNSRMLFEADRQGDIAAVTIPLEPDARPIRFIKTEGSKH